MTAYMGIPLAVLTPGFLESLANFVKEENEIDGTVVITSLEEEVDEYGGCPTCAGTDHELRISYCVDGRTGFHMIYSGSFSYLVGRLVEL